MAICLSFACNDEHGNPVGKFNALEVDAGAMGNMRIQGPCYVSDGVTVAFAFPVRGGYGTVQIGRLRLRGLYYREWYGNWCWNAAGFIWCDALRILNYLAKNSDWHMEEGPCGLFEAFNDRRVITPIEWRDA